MIIVATIWYKFFSDCRIQKYRNFFSLLFFPRWQFNFFQFFLYDLFGMRCLIEILMSSHRANFSNEIGCETWEARRTWLLFFHKFNPLDSLTQFAGPSAVPPCRQFTCSRIGSGNERGNGGERETRYVCKRSLPLPSAKGTAIHLALALRRKQHLASQDITISLARPLNSPNSVVRPCIKLTRVHRAHPTTRPGCGPNVPPNSR